LSRPVLWKPHRISAHETECPSLAISLDSAADSERPDKQAVSGELLHEASLWRACADNRATWATGFEAVPLIKPPPQWEVSD